MPSEVRAPDGRTWVVQRRWVPRLGRETAWGRFHRRYRQAVRTTGNISDVADPGCFEIVGEGVAAAVAVIVVLVLIVYVGIPIVFAVLDLTAVLVLAVLGVLARALFRRPWTIEARASDGTVLTWRVVGWRASGDRCSEVERSLTAGVLPPGSDGG